MRNEIFYSKKFLKDNAAGVSITEHLTRYNLQLLNAAKNHAGFKNAWSKQGMIYMHLNGRTFDVKSIPHL